MIRNPAVSRNDASAAFTGSCLCGAVRFTGAGLRGVVYCHCSQCRRAHGTVAAYTATALAGLEFSRDRDLRWYDASPRARRGFCRRCGSNLFWAPHADTAICVAAAAIDEGPALEALCHVFTESRAPWERIGERLPRHGGSMRAAPG